MIARKPLSPFDPRVYRPRRKPVTIAAGFVCQDGVLLCADTKITTNIKTEESKIEKFISDDGMCSLTFVMSSDDLNFPRAAIRACFQAMREVDCRNASMRSIQLAAEKPLAKFYRDHIYTHPDWTPSSIFQQLLLGIRVRNETALFQPHETLLMPVEECECIGSGAYLAKYLVQECRRANAMPASLDEAKWFAEHILEKCIDYDEHCGGEREIILIRNNGRIDSATSPLLFPGRAFIQELESLVWRVSKELATSDMTEAGVDEIFERYSQEIRKARTYAKKDLLNLFKIARQQGLSG